jgi:hypothetical protein
VNFSISTLDEDVWKRIEPATAKPRKRLEAMRFLSERGIRCGVLLAPVLPGLTDDPEDLERVVDAAREHGASFIHDNVLYLKPGTKEWFMPFLREAYPHLSERYAKYYRGAYAPQTYTQDVHRTVERLRLKYGMVAPRRVQPSAGQLLQHVGVADDVRRLRDDAGGVREVAQHLEDSVRERVLQLGGLVRIAGRAYRDQFTPPRRPCEVLPQHLGRVDLHDHARLEVAAAVVAEVLVGAASEAIRAGVLAATIRVQRPAEGHVAGGGRRQLPYRGLARDFFEDDIGHRALLTGSVQPFYSGLAV